MKSFSSAVTVGRPSEIFFVTFFLCFDRPADFFAAGAAFFFFAMVWPRWNHRPHDTNAAAIAFDKCSSRHGARARSAVVKRMQKPPLSGSIHSRLPVEPVWPNACRPSRSHKADGVPGELSFQPSPHGAVRRTGSGKSGKSSSRFVVIILQ